MLEKEPIAYPPQMAEENPPEQEQKPKTRVLKKIFLWGGIFLLVLFIAFSWRILSNSDKNIFLSNPFPSFISLPSSSSSLLKELKNLIMGQQQQLRGEENDKINVLILGIGGEGHDGPYLTDTILLASFHPSANSLTLLSLPRDLVVNLPPHGFRRVNSINAFGEAQQKDFGAELTRLAIASLFDLDIPYVIRIDFSAFEQFVNDQGGIEIEVEKSFTDPTYPAPENQSMTISFQKGKQKMDGEHALWYVRSRYGCCGENGDFARARRQQHFLLALKDQLMTQKIFLQPKQILHLYQNYQKHVTSNFKIWEILRLAALVKEHPSPQVTERVLNNEPGGELETIIGADGAYLLQPKNGDYHIFKDIARELIENGDANTTVDNKPWQKTENAKIFIFNGTFIDGLASNTAELLKKQGYDVREIGNARERDSTSTVIYDLGNGKKPESINALQQELHAKVEKNIPAWILSEIDSPDSNLLQPIDLVIVLGSEN